jgi:hypothetical protein
MNKILVASVAIAALVVSAAVGPNPAFAASTGPGKKSAFESSDFGGGDIPVGVTTLLTASIEKGKKKYVLVVEATLSSGSSPVSNYLEFGPRVNGVEMEPGYPNPNFVLQACGGDPCTLTGTWWLDLDAAELDHPGIFINQPLTVTLHGGEGFASPQSDGRVTMGVRLQKK